MTEVPKSFVSIVSGSQKGEFSNKTRGPLLSMKYCLFNDGILMVAYYYKHGLGSQKGEFSNHGLSVCVHLGNH